jgi:hypothetical protein
MTCQSGMSVCNPATGTCMPTPTPDGTTCDDGLLCTENDVCLSGTCTGTPITCASTDPCLNNPGSCDPADGFCLFPDGAICDDANPCTGPDTCLTGVCQPGPIIC